MPRKHTPDTCNVERGEECDCQGYYCRGGLMACTVCYGIEGTLPTVCPGRKMSVNLREEVYQARADYREVPTLTGSTCRWVWAAKFKILESVTPPKEVEFVVQKIGNWEPK